jgi:hypothetical protein
MDFFHELMAEISVGKARLLGSDLIGLKVWQARKQRWIPDIGCADSGMTGVGGYAAFGMTILISSS